ncbi:MAG: hypothetical protein HF300_03625 [Ignavibacteria bacterium]|jgi:hypothetical protein|nr:hypothetical protein [Ignavibacteria bacterium]HEX2961876.1 hypothetical protein [Ignavibacteriales bacterium]MCU7498579.1 hypothetical protein [Ignavibacteria bacterium]MCU7511621.1 hypothetical protein [Ignavibacteria bacterium]MCU7519165.1 hypothetical protein [Ignavibacteria bacterium]
MKKACCFAFNITFILFLLCGFSRAQGKIDVSFEAGEGDKIFISYFLYDDASKTYEVSTILRKSNDPSFKLTPKDLSGDIGEGKFANRKCTIIWNMNKDEEAQLEGEDFYFEVSADEIKEKSSWYWYVLGAAALGGGTAAYLLLNKDKSSEPSSPMNPAGDNVAVPPGRP